MKVLLLALFVVVTTGLPQDDVKRLTPSRMLRMKMARDLPSLESVEVPYLAKAKLAKAAGAPSKTKSIGTKRTIKALDLIEDALIGEVVKQTPAGASLLRIKRSIGFGRSAQQQIIFSPRQNPVKLADRLISNATLIRPDIIDGFSCDTKQYGYYADPQNDCQIFHVCLPMQQLFPANFTNGPTYTFSFICPYYTIFSQDVRVCAWKTEALECQYAEQLYNINEDFFKIPVKDTTPE